jgi:hypothetical protein
MSLEPTRSVRFRAPLAGTLAALLGVTACSRTAADDATATASLTTEASRQPEYRLASATAFDLRATSSGATLAWVEVSSEARRLYLAQLDARGELVGAPSVHRLAADPAILGDLSVVATANGPTLTWVESSQGVARARAAQQRPDGMLETFELGTAYAGASPQRGNLALAARGREALALVRGTSVPCAVRSEGRCSQFHFYRLGVGEPEETGMPLSVPLPCEAHSVQLLSSEAQRAFGSVEMASLHYAVCTSSDGIVVLTLFEIEPDQQYAAAYRSFEGCAPLGAGVFGGVPSFVAGCGADRRLAAQRAGNAPPDVIDINVRGLVCDGEVPRLRLGSAWLRLDAPLGDLELLLDADLAAPGARAVWTGAALLIATSDAAGMHLSRFACINSGLRALANPLGPG